MLEDKNKLKTDINSLGEFGLIDILTENIKIKNPSTIKGIGDDAAVMNFKNNDVLVSTDLLIEGVHFDLSYFPLKHLGYKAAIVNFSDIYAMNGKASQLTVALAVSNRFPVEALKEIFEGIKLACDLYDVDFVGGDTTSSLKGLVISPSIIGHIKSGTAVYRNGAQEGDLIVVSGDLGASYLGLLVLQREKEVFKVDPNNQPDLSKYTYLIERQLKPEARKDIPPLLAKLNVQPTAMIDISDGLSSEIKHLAKNSGLGAVIYEEKIPMDPQVILTADEFNLNPLTAALNGGEDYELLFTIKQDDYNKIKGNPHLSIIGHMTKETGTFLISKANEKIELKAQGWDALKHQ